MAFLKNTKLHWLKKYIFIFIIIFFGLLYCWRGVIGQIPITEWDESKWPGRGYFFELLIKGDFKNSLWEEDFGFNQPKLVEYLFGAVVYNDYLKEKAKATGNYDLGNYLVENNFREIRGSAYDKALSNSSGPPSQQLIFKIRVVNIALFLVSLAVVYFIVLTIFGVGPALLTVVMFGLSDYVIRVNALAQSESLFLLLFSLSLLQFYLILFKNKRGFWQFTLLAVSLGLLTETKINGLILLAVFDLILTGELIIKKEAIRMKLQSLIPIVHMNLLAWIIFVAVNPFLYPAPLERTLFVYKYRDKVTKAHYKIFSSVRMDSYPSRLKGVYRNFFTNFGRQQEKYLFSGPFNLLNNILIIVLNPVFFIVGMIKSLKNSKHRVFVVTFVLTLFFTILYLRLDWERYYIHLTLFFAAFSAYGAIEAVRFFGSGFRLKKPLKGSIG